MSKRDLSASFLSEKSPEAVFHAINTIQAWWTASFEGQSEKRGNIFTVHFGETFITIRITELFPFQKIVWHVTDCNKHWLKDKKEWKDTEIIWEIAPAENGAQISFTHLGLVPGMECYQGCQKAWSFYIKDSLFSLLSEGKGKPEI